MRLSGFSSFLASHTACPRSSANPPCHRANATWCQCPSGSSPRLLEHTQIPELRAIVQVRVPLAGAPEGTALPKQPTTAEALLQAGWGPGSRFSCDSRRTSEHLPLCPFLPMTIPRAASSTTFSGRWPAKRISGTLSVPVASPFARRHSLICEPWCVRQKPLAIRSYRPASDAHLLPTLLQTLALGWRLTLLPPPSCRSLYMCGASWPLGAFCPLAPVCTVDRGKLPAGGRTLTGLLCSSQCPHVPSPGAYHL